jgi:hypothetical protein
VHASSLGRATPQTAISSRGGVKPAILDEGRCRSNALKFALIENRFIELQTAFALKLEQEREQTQ